MNLAIATAEKNGATVILANDPGVFGAAAVAGSGTTTNTTVSLADADRLAVAAKHAGEWRIFSGNEIGALLGAHCWERFRARRPEADAGKCVMLSSSVSSMVLRSIAATEGFRVSFATGFFF